MDSNGELILFMAPTQASLALLIGGAVAIWSGLHMDPRTRAGAAASSGLARLRDRLREAARASGSIGSETVRAMLPAGTTAEEAEVWAVAAGCRTIGSERVVGRLRSIQYMAGRPLIGSTERIELTIDDLFAKLRGLVLYPWHRGRPAGPEAADDNGSQPVVW